MDYQLWRRAADEWAFTLCVCVLGEGVFERIWKEREKHGERRRWGGERRGERERERERAYLCR